MSKNLIIYVKEKQNNYLLIIVGSLSVPFIVKSKCFNQTSVH